MRDCLAIRTRDLKPNNPRLDDTRSRLGGAVLAAAVTDSALSAEARLAKLKEAESLLLIGNDGLQRGQIHHKYQRDALVRLVQLYEAWDEFAPDTGKAEKAAEWKQKLEAFDKTSTQTQAESEKEQQNEAVTPP